jgi:hypothetical protein
MMHILFNIKYELNTSNYSGLCEAYMQTDAEYAINVSILG